jgi:hypothetical protein
MVIGLKALKFEKEGLIQQGFVDDLNNASRQNLRPEFLRKYESFKLREDYYDLVLCLGKIKQSVSLNIKNLEEQLRDNEIEEIKIKCGKFECSINRDSVRRDISFDTREIKCNINPNSITIEVKEGKKEYAEKIDIDFYAVRKDNSGNEKTRKIGGIDIYLFPVHQIKVKVIKIDNLNVENETNLEDWDQLKKEIKDKTKEYMRNLFYDVRFVEEEYYIPRLRFKNNVNDDEVRECRNTPILDFIFRNRSGNTGTLFDNLKILVQEFEKKENLAWVNYYFNDASIAELKKANEYLIKDSEDSYWVDNVLVVGFVRGEGITASQFNRMAIAEFYEVVSGNSVLSHELGHWRGLPHTFDQSENLIKVEQMTDEKGITLTSNIMDYGKNRITWNKLQALAVAEADLAKLTADSVLNWKSYKQLYEKKNKYQKKLAGQIDNYWNNRITDVRSESDLKTFSGDNFDWSKDGINKRENVIEFYNNVNYNSGSLGNMKKYEETSDPENAETSAIKRLKNVLKIAGRSLEHKFKE